MKLFSLVFAVVLAVGGADARAEGALRVSVSTEQKEIKAGEPFQISYTIRNASEEAALFYLWDCSSAGQWRSDLPGLVPEEPACLRDGPILRRLAAGDSMSGSETFVYLGFSPPHEPVTVRMKFQPAHENMQGEPSELLAVESDNELQLRILPGDTEQIARKINGRRDRDSLLHLQQKQ